MIVNSEGVIPGSLPAGYSGNYKYIIGDASSVNISKAGSYGSAGWKCYLCVDSTNSRILDQVSTVGPSGAIRDPANDIELFSFNSSNGLKYTLNSADFDNWSPSTEIVIKILMLYNPPYDQLFIYYTGNKLRNRVYHTGSWSEPYSYGYWPSGLCRFLINPDTLGFGMEDWVDGDYNDALGSAVVGATALYYTESYSSSSSAISSLVPVLTNTRIKPYTIGKDNFSHRLDIYTARSRNKKRFKKANVFAELFMNYNSSWELVSSGYTNSEGILHLSSTTAQVPTITNCLGYFRVTYDSKQYTSNIARYNCISSHLYLINAGTCQEQITPLDRTNYIQISASGVNRSGFYIYTRPQLRNII